MAQDIKDLFKDDKVSNEKMPTNHQVKFLDKLEEVLPQKKETKFSWLHVAASVALLLGLSFGACKYFQPEIDIPLEVAVTEDTARKTLGDVSPGLKKVEDYYLASINLELSKMKPTAETKDLFDGYLEQLNGLNKEYERLSIELAEIGPNELMVNALIDNLKMRLNLLYRLRDQVSSLTKDVNKVPESA